MYNLDRNRTRIPTVTSFHKLTSNHFNQSSTPSMGASHLICLYHSGRIVVAQYGGHDGHPSYTGREIMDLLSDARYIRRLRANLSLVRYRERKSYGDYTDDTTGLRILDDIAYARGSLLHSFGLDFADEGGVCEWCYLIDLDAEVLEVYHGVRLERLEARPVRSGRLAEAGVSQQILKISIPFIDLPGEKEELVKACTAGLNDFDDEEVEW
jgi:hypothetical protein